MSLTVGNISDTQKGPLFWEESRGSSLLGLSIEWGKVVVPILRMFTKYIYILKNNKTCSPEPLTKDS